MRLANLARRPVLIHEGQAVELDSVFPDQDAVGVIAHWDLDRARTALETAPRSSFDPLALGAPVPVPGKIVGAPVNYRRHQVEMNVEHTIAGLGFFLKSPTSVIGPDGAVAVPFPNRRTDQEAELGVVIGRGGSNIDAGTALDHVFGYTCLVDVTVRGPEERSTRKSFPGFTPTGPWITTTDEVPDPMDLTSRGWVNGELRQDASSQEMIFSVAQLIEFISSVVRLDPGDIIATGTPAGVGPIGPGDQIRVEIGGVGDLSVPVIASGIEPHPLWLSQLS